MLFCDEGRNVGNGRTMTGPAKPIDTTTNEAIFTLWNELADFDATQTEATRNHP